MAMEHVLLEPFHAAKFDERKERPKTSRPRTAKRGTELTVMQRPKTARNTTQDVEFIRGGVTIPGEMNGDEKPKTAFQKYLSEKEVNNQHLASFQPASRRYFMPSIFQ